MATLAATRVSASYLDQSSPASGFHIEIWRVASGGANGDTAAITPARGRFVVSVVGGPASHDLGTAGTNTNVTLTVRTGTNTVGAFDVQILVQE